jgi:hypothetical protein
MICTVSVIFPAATVSKCLSQAALVDKIISSIFVIVVGSVFGGRWNGATLYA